MDFQSLAILYASKTDEELLHLAAELDQLTLEAQSVLRSEMTRRRLVPTEIGAENLPEPTPASSKAVPQARPVSLEVGEFIGSVFRLYHEHLWTFIKLATPAVAIGTFALLGARYAAREVIRHPYWNSSKVGMTLIAAALVNMIAWAVSWLVFSFAFASICVVVRQITQGDKPKVSKAWRDVLPRLSSLLRISLALFFVFITLVGLGELLTTALIFRFFRSFILQHPIVSLAWGFCVYGAVALIVSRFSLTVPAVVLDSVKVVQSFFYSDELTEKRWIILAILLTKSILGGYIAGMLPFWVAGWLRVPKGISPEAWASWVLTGVSILAVSYVEPIMFIGFALLYEKTSGRKENGAFQTVAAS